MYEAGGAGCIWKAHAESANIASDMPAFIFTTPPRSSEIYSSWVPASYGSAFSCRDATRARFAGSMDRWNQRTREQDSWGVFAWLDVRRYSAMVLEFLSDSDAERAIAVLEKLQRHGIHQWVLTGGLAIELHLALRGLPTVARPFNDLDFVVPRFDCIPESLDSEFLCRHIHPPDPPGKTIAQFVDSQQRLRVDVFRASEALFNRTVHLQSPIGSTRLVSLEDLIARLTRIVLQVGEDTAVPSKHAHDLVRLLQIADPAKIQTVWFEHRRDEHPLNFREASAMARQLIFTRPLLFRTVQYSTNADEVCERCAPTAGFQLASAQTILSILGYC